MKHSLEKYHWSGMEDMSFIKGLDVFDFYKIYFHWWYINFSLNKWIKSSFNLLEFEDFTYEHACNHYWKFKNEIKLNHGK